MAEVFNTRKCPGIVCESQEEKEGQELEGPYSNMA